MSQKHSIESDLNHEKPAMTRPQGGVLQERTSMCRRPVAGRSLEYERTRKKAARVTEVK